MSCPFCSSKDGKVYCELSRDEVNQQTQEKYCSDDQYIQYCPTYEKAEVLTESACNEILHSFGEAVQNVQEGFYGFVQVVTALARECDYLPVHDACRILEDPPQIPKCGNTYLNMVSTDQERALAGDLDSALDELLDAMQMSISYGSGGGEFPCVSPSQIDDAAARADYYYGSLVAECMDNLHISVKPEKYAQPAEELAAQCGDALRTRLGEVIDALQEASRILAAGMNSTAAAAEQDRGWVLRDAGIHWEVE